MQPSPIQQFAELRNIIEIISNTYAPLNVECQNELTDNCRLVTLKKRTHLVHQGQLSDKVYYLADGCARAYYLKDGRDISEWFAFENEFISSISSFFNNAPSPLYIELLEDTTLLELSRATIDHLADKYHDFERLMRVAVTKTMLVQQKRITSIQFQSAEERYDSLLKTHSNITQRVALTHIASYLGITLETLSRIRNPKNRI